MPRKPKPQPRRPHGSGSVFKRKDGRWVATLPLRSDIDPQTGKRRRLSQTTYHATDREAYAWLDAALLELAKGSYIPPDKVTVAEFMQTWLDTIIAPNKAPNTYTTYQSIYRNHVAQRIGSVGLQKLTTPQCQEMLADILVSRGSKPLVRYVRVVMIAAFNQAVSWGLVSRNVWVATIVPSYRSPEMHILSREESARLLDCARPHRFYAAFVIALVLGLRVGEYLSLRWDNLDFNKGTLQVKTTVQRITGKGRVIKPTKTRSSERTIHLPRVVLDALRERRDIQYQERISAGARWAEGGYIFTTPRGRVYMPSNFRMLFYKLREEAGISEKVRCHDMRHTAASLAILNGIPIPIVSKMLGHSNPSMTLRIYSHVVESSWADARDKLDQLWG